MTRQSRGPLPWRRRVMVAIGSLVLGGHARAQAAPLSEASGWMLRGQGQLPVLSARHVVGGFGLGAAVERSIWALDGEVQLLPIIVCPSACGIAYEAGLGLAVQPRLGRGVTSRLALMLQYYAHPALHQYVPTLGPKVGFRWPDGPTAVSLDLVMGFAVGGSPDSAGFASNKIVRGAIPELVLGLWFF